MPHTDMWRSHLKTRKTKTKVNPNQLYRRLSIYETYKILRRRGNADWLVTGLGMPLNYPLYGLVVQSVERRPCKAEADGAEPSRSTNISHRRGAVPCQAHTLETQVRILPVQPLGWCKFRLMAESLTSLVHRKCVESTHICLDSLMVKHYPHKVRE